MADKVRAFVAVDVDERLRRQVARVQDAFRPVAAAKWVDPELCHITLRFLGYVPADQLPAIGEACRRAAAVRGPFDLGFKGVGAFPRWRGARVLWLGLGTGEAALRELQAAVEVELAALGFGPEERPFAPHLTLARFKAPGRELEDVARQFERERFGSVHVADLRLMRSDLRPSGPIYTVVERFALRNY
ncbi:MAG TPA: RNA 2',3'-cyclic phosphodiesterase [Chloroflexota bacterium]